MRSAVAAVLIVGLLAVACTADEPTGAPAVPKASVPASAAPGTSPAAEPPATASEPRLRTGRIEPADFDTSVAMGAVRHLAGDIGPRHATSPAFEKASRWVAGELRELGYDVRRQPVATPGGDSWGVPVAAGTSYNVVASLPGVDVKRPHLVVGAHLDTVPQSPGAEDNASGVGVVLATARAVAERRTRLPVVLVAFGAEEPRGPSDADHHFGSRAYVASLSPRERRAVRGMLSLDRVGVGAAVPVGSALEGGADPAREEVLAAARRTGVPTLLDDNRSSDHWSFVRAGLPGVRLGSTPYAGYHSSADTVDVVQSAQLERAGRLLLAWLAPR